MPKAAASIPNGGLKLGSHMSVAGGMENAPARGASVGCTAIQVFVKNNNRWVGHPIRPGEPERWRDALAASGIGIDAVFAHTCYLINLASTKEETVTKSIDALEDELRRCEAFGIPGLVMHPGAHLGAGREAGIDQIARGCREVFRRFPEGKTRILFETTVGAGTHLGGRFEDLRDVIAAVDTPARTGVCLDTCHVFAAGYDIREKKGFDATIAEFDEVVGLGELRALHLNDSKFGLGLRKDRHEHIGQGALGLEAFRLVVNHPKLRSIPMSLETEKGEDLAEDRMNLDALRGLIGKKSA